MFGLFGLVGRIGCAIVLLILGAVLWHFRAAWLPKAKEMFRRETGIRVGYEPPQADLRWRSA